MLSHQSVIAAVHAGAHTEPYKARCRVSPPPRTLCRPPGALSLAEIDLAVLSLFPRFDHKPVPPFPCPCHPLSPATPPLQL